MSALWHGSLVRGVLRPCVAHTWAQARSHTTEASAAWPFWQIMIQTNNKVIEMCAVCFSVVSGISCSSHIINRLWLMSKSVQLSIPKYPVDGHVAQYPIAAFIYLIHTSFFSKSNTITALIPSPTPLTTLTHTPQHFCHGLISQVATAPKNTAFLRSMYNYPFKLSTIITRINVSIFLSSLLI